MLRKARVEFKWEGGGGGGRRYRERGVGTSFFSVSLEEKKKQVGTLKRRGYGWTDD